MLFCLVIDKIGYGKSMIFAFVCHVASVFLTIFAQNYWHLYFGACLCGLAAGTVEAIINPAVATLYPKNKTKMLSILHAGWPGGIVLGGIIILLMGGDVSWKLKVGVLLVPTVVYGLMMLRCKFPVNERVAAGVPYKDMLKEAGALGALIVIFLIMKEIGRVFPISDTVVFTLSKWSYSVTDMVVYGVISLVSVVYLIYTRSLGRWMYVFLLLVMILLAITELGTDGWIKELRDPAMKKLGLDGGWILIYTATIMMVLRFCIGPIVKALKPLGVLLASALFAAVGLFLLSDAQMAGWILITATIYGIGQTFFWPVTLGVVAERFPKGGALSLNAIAGVGMLGVGIFGGPLLGRIQDTSIERNLKTEGHVHTEYISPKAKKSVLGDYYALDGGKVQKLTFQVQLHDAAQKVFESQTRPAEAAALTAALGADKDYKALVVKTYEAMVEEVPDKSKLPAFDKLYAALKDKGLLLDAGQYKVAKADFDKVDGAVTIGKQDAMAQIAILPLIMAACYLGLIIYFRRKGGYTVVELTAEGTKVGEHKPTVAEEVADEEATPSE